MKKCSMPLDIREMHINTIMGHYTPIRMTKIKKTHYTKCWRGCGATEIYMLMPYTLENRTFIS